MEAYRCEKCKKHFDGSGRIINTINHEPDGRFAVKMVEVCPKCFSMIDRFCRHKPKGIK